MNSAPAALVMTAKTSPAREDPVERARAVRAAVHASLPELLPVLRELVDLGLVTGWRNVQYCVPVKDAPAVRGVRGPFLTGREFSEGVTK